MVTVMKARLGTLLGAALFVLASNFSAAARTVSVYDVTDGELTSAFFGTFTFSGSFDVESGLVSSVAINLTGPGGKTLALDDVAPVSSIGHVFRVGADDLLDLLTFSVILPPTSSSPILDATLSLLVGGRIIPFVTGGTGDVSLDPVPIAAALPLLAGGFALMCMAGRRRKRRERLPLIAA
jgi:hypothetical protein